MLNCSQSKDIDEMVFNEYKNCNCDKPCVINFGILLDFEWDTMCFYSGALSLEEINADLGFELENFVDIGDRVIFLNKNRVVYQKEWSLNQRNQKEYVVFNTNKPVFKIDRNNAIFLVKKEGPVYYLELIRN